MNNAYIQRSPALDQELCVEYTCTLGINLHPETTRDGSVKNLSTFFLPSYTTPRLKVICSAHPRPRIVVSLCRECVLYRSTYSLLAWALAAYVREEASSERATWKMDACGVRTRLLCCVCPAESRGTSSSSRGVEDRLGNVTSSSLRTWSPGLALTSVKRKFLDQKRACQHVSWWFTNYLSEEVIFGRRAVIDYTSFYQWSHIIVGSLRLMWNA